MSLFWESLWFVLQVVAIAYLYLFIFAMIGLALSKTRKT